MNKERVIDAVEELSKENQILVDLPDNNSQSADKIDYHTMIKELILMALPSPSHRIH
ncbi:MAG: hypothetical protein JSS07_06070 [Proteobacteria bacterium]|nr:hypothetical protein [Pseudomonadota bacterium]